LLKQRMMSFLLGFGMFLAGSLDVEVRVDRFRTVVVESIFSFRRAATSVLVSLRNCLGDNDGIFPTEVDELVLCCALTACFCGEPDHFG